MLIVSILFFLACLGNTNGILQVSPIQKAVAVLSGPIVTGIVYFTQELPGGPVTISGDLKNVAPNAERGFHVHDFGDATNGCLSMGGHYNPLNRTHGAPSDFERHVGDLGNVQSNASGIVALNISDNQISLNGPFSIIGRSIVIHLDTDDLGRGNNTESLLNGNSGPRAGCGVIGIAAN